jgi:hypothetical protein
MDYRQRDRRAGSRQRFRTQETAMFEYPRIPYDFHAARARQLRAEAFGAMFKRIAAFFRRQTECDDCGKPIVIS